MEVNVKDRLPRPCPVVLHDTEPGFGIPLLTGNLAGFPEDIADQRIVLCGHIDAVYEMLFRQQQQMQRRLWINILDNEQLLGMLNPGSASTAPATPSW